eukprot:CAMPEP_0202903496 /NCGR_PEP_ID=MMETSP1392-20130828/24742_1 /ASSEMBLY_ACC=CAM_ASM_000868 /TAXON_ID=225041 /ORGANISM="Chlamydomonas chlamydogama, Strain SAG 11-48b" /LENGTH=76 /DNA_ID=CAMNT_0049590707 /DNA_START=85 /DNA_END=312 /DNA_ORIENTATION=-
MALGLIQTRHKRTSPCCAADLLYCGTAVLPQYLMLLVPVRATPPTADVLPTVVRTAPVLPTVRPAAAGAGEAERDT